MNEILIMATIITPITTGFVQAIKTATEINKKYLPILAIVTGVILGGLAFFLDAEIGFRLWSGAIAGLASVGLYEGLEKTVLDK